MDAYECHDALHHDHADGRAITAQGFRRNRAECETHASNGYGDRR